MSDKTIAFITGANTGIGFETIKALFASQHPYHVLLGARDLSKADTAIAKLKDEFADSKSTVEPIQIDVVSDESIHKAFEAISSKFDKLDVLINNAGGTFEMFFDQDVPKYRELFNKAYDVNTTGAQVVTATFAPLLIKSSNPRLLFITSGLSTLEGSSKGLLPNVAMQAPSGWPKEGLLTSFAYRASKAGLNMTMLVWHSLLKGDGVKTWCISPGFVHTGLGGMPDKMKEGRAGDPATSGDFIKRVLEGERDEDAGKVVHVGGGVQAW
ncbi:hypothetical protein B0T10DRAFT_461833 [Thelonectria olida]|uniref:Uncharacterized protein n=1 Tax=Thelonectria olida TaxID=1576542 RepID=A0A9P8W1C8_9HYPO|nr:hypothetical protein B0T10DRAFT_461833 [Thelonectria olida]